MTSLLVNQLAFANINRIPIYRRNGWIENIQKEEIKIEHFNKKNQRKMKVYYTITSLLATVGFRSLA
jgi:hypothetical protein